MSPEECRCSIRTQLFFPALAGLLNLSPEFTREERREILTSAKQIICGAECDVIECQRWEDWR